MRKASERERCCWCFPFIAFLILFTMIALTLRLLFFSLTQRSSHFVLKLYRFLNINCSSICILEAKKKKKRENNEVLSTIVVMQHVLNPFHLSAFFFFIWCKSKYVFLCLYFSIKNTLWDM